MFTEQGLSGVISSAEYEVNALLAGIDENPQYQLTCADQSHHRVVSEKEISAMTAAELDLSASFCVDEAHGRQRPRPMLTDPALFEP